MTGLAELSAFERVGSLGSFVVAARALRLTPSAVSKAIARLESRLGAKLLVRTTRRLRLTEAGAGFHAHCRRLLAELDEAERAVGRTHGAPAGRLRVELPLRVGTQQIIRSLPAFTEAFPGIELDVRLDDRYADLVDDDIDVAVRVGQLRDSRLIARRLTHARHLLVAAPAYLATRPAPRTIDDLEKHDRLLFRSRNSGRVLDWVFERSRRRISWPPRRGHTFSSSDALIAAATAGMGIAQVLDLSAADAVAAGQLRPLLPRFAAEGPPVSVVSTPEKLLLPKVRVFRDFVATLPGAWTQR
jgi:DNA-binding transcriptional LysR family regulator